MPNTFFTLLIIPLAQLDSELNRLGFLPFIPASTPSDRYSPIVLNSLEGELIPKNPLTQPMMLSTHPKNPDFNGSFCSSTPPISPSDRLIPNAFIVSTNSGVTSKTFSPIVSLINEIVPSAFSLTSRLSSNPFAIASLIFMPASVAVWSACKKFGSVDSFSPSK